MIFLITENEVVTLTNETTLSNESNNKFYAGIILIISIIENIVIENIEFSQKYHTLIENSTIYISHHL